MTTSKQDEAHTLSALVVGCDSEICDIVELLSVDTGFVITAAYNIALGEEMVAMRPPFDLIVLFCDPHDAPTQNMLSRLTSSIKCVPVVVILPVRDDRLMFSMLLYGAHEVLVLGEFDNKSLIRSMIFACARCAYSQAHDELESVRRQVAEMASQLGVVQQAYLELIESVTTLNESLTITEGTNDAATNPR